MVFRMATRSDPVAPLPEKRKRKREKDRQRETAKEIHAGWSPECITSF